MTSERLIVNPCKRTSRVAVTVAQSLLVPAMLVIALALGASGCATSRDMSDAENRVVVVLPVIEHLDVSSCKGQRSEINRLLSDRAEDYARRFEAANVWYGAGASMEPLLEPGWWIVTRPCDYEKLEPGMVVLYTSSSGRPVAHALVRKTSRGWLAAGVNNSMADAEFVTSKNITGVLAAAFAPAPVR